MQQLIPKIDFKLLRAKVIDNYMVRAGYLKAVCFSCGNAAEALAACSVDVIEVGPRGDFQTARWWSPEEIHALWPDRFDATPGHLPFFLMLRIALRIRDVLGAIDGEDYPGVGLHVPTGSGETIMCFHLAYPAYKFVAVYDDNYESTRYFSGAPLSGVVGRMFTPIYIEKGDKNSFENWPQEAQHD